MSALSYDLNYLHHMDEISLSFLDFYSPMQSSLSFLLIDESYTNTILKLRLNHMQCMPFETSFLHNFFF